MSNNGNNIHCNEDRERMKKQLIDDFNDKREQNGNNPITTTPERQKRIEELLVDSTEYQQFRDLRDLSVAMGREDTNLEGTLECRYKNSVLDKLTKDKCKLDETYVDEVAELILKYYKKSPWKSSLIAFAKIVGITLDKLEESLNKAKKAPDNWASFIADLEIPSSPAPSLIPGFGSCSMSTNTVLTGSTLMNSPVANVMYMKLAKQFNSGNIDEVSLAHELHKSLSKNAGQNFQKFLLAYLMLDLGDNTVRDVALHLSEKTASNETCT